MKLNDKAKLLLSLGGLVLVLLFGTLLYNSLKTDFPEKLPADSAGANSSVNSAPVSGAQSEQLTPAPDFTVQDNDGNSVTLSSFKGKGVVINFWASWCPYCLQEMPDFEEQFKEIGEDVQFMMVDAIDGNRETLELGKEYIEKAGYTFPVYFDTEYEAAIAYGVSGLPCTYFVDKDGNIVDAVYG